MEYFASYLKGKAEFCWLDLYSPETVEVLISKTPRNSPIYFRSGEPCGIEEKTNANLVVDLLESFEGGCINSDVLWSTNFSKPMHYVKIGKILRDECKIAWTTLSNVQQDDTQDNVFKGISSWRTRATSTQDRKNRDQAPMMSQEMLKGKNIRVHLVGQKFYAQEARSSYLDYRYDKNVSFKNIALSETVIDAIRKVAKMERLIFPESI